MDDHPVEIPRPVGLAHGRLRMLFVEAQERSDVRIAKLPMQLTRYANAVALPVRPTDRGQELGRVVGTLYDSDGALIVAAQRARPGRRWRSNPERIDPPGDVGVTRLAGMTFFGGQLTHVFGHVLLEVLARFGRDLDYAAYDHVLLYPNVPAKSEAPVPPPTVVLDVLDLVGVRPDQVVVAGAAPLRLDSVDVAPCPVRLTRAADPRLADVFRRVGDAVMAEGGAGATPRQVYLSRSALLDRRRASNEDEIEAIFVAAGFDVVHPQSLPVRSQVALARGADVIAGCDGSALHLAAFATPGTRVLALDVRPTPNQLLIDWVTGIDAVHANVRVGPFENRKVEWVADLDRVARALDVTLDRVDAAR